MIARVVYGLTWAFGILSLEGQRRAGRWLGRLFWWLGTDAARTTRTNLDLCFPALSSAERRRLGRQSLEHTGQLVTEAGVLFHWDAERWQRLAVAVEGETVIETARAAGRPVLLLAPHIGNWEFLALYLGRHRITALYDPPKLRALEPLIRHARSRAGARLLPLDGAGLKALYQALAHGGLVGLLPDQVPARRSGVYSSFFGVPALTMTLAHRLVRRFDVQVVLGSALRCPGGFRLRFQALDTELRDPDAATSAAAMNQAIEALVRAEPAQYQWEYKRFKRPPPGQPSPYRRRRRFR